MVWELNYLVVYIRGYFERLRNTIIISLFGLFISYYTYST